jgi:murein L,D-transpeptidase YcbB/YkuD
MGAAAPAPAALAGALLLLLAGRCLAPQAVADSRLVAAPSVGRSLAARLAAAGDSLTVAGQKLPTAALRDSYATAGYAPLWTDAHGLAPAGALLIERLRDARAAGMTMIDPLLGAIGDHAGAKGVSELADLELLLSGALQAATARSGDLAPDALLKAARQGNLRRFLAVHLPRSFFYWRLLAALPRYRHYAEAGGWPTVPSGPNLQPGLRDPRVEVLRQRLMATAELPDPTSEPARGQDPDLFDDSLAAGLRRFQAHHGLDPDGKLDARTVDALNVSAEDRLNEILINLGRFRQLSPSMGARYLYVNIAGMELTLVEQGEVTFHNRVIVGRIDRKTPLLRSVIRRIDFNPTWVVPARIARIDMLDHLRQDPDYFRSHNVRVYDGWSPDAQEIDTRRIDWSQYDAGNMPFVLRQDPGPDNELGPVTFDFANGYAVYIHGTPVKSEFSQAQRALSSGCVRMEQPVDMAAYLLRNNPHWPRSRIDDVVRQAKTISAPIAPLPVLLSYETAWADADGTVQFRPDIYGLDRPAGYASAGATRATNVPDETHPVGNKS